MKREYSIDMIRVLCCLLVVLGHCLLVSIHQSPVPVDPALSARIEQIIVLMRWIVPTFIIITGYCIAKKKTCTFSYCFSHVLRFIEVLFSIGLFFAMLELVFSERTFNGTTVVKAFGNVISGRLWDHMYYVYLIIGIYLVLPVIHCFLQQDQKEVITITALLFVFTILIPYLDKWIYIDVRLPFSGVLFYVFFGGTVAKINTKKEWRYLYLIIILICAVYMIVFLKTDSWENLIHPAVCLMAMSFFLLMRDIDVKPNNGLLTLAGLTWGVYLIHPFFINVAVKVFGIDLIGHLAWLKITVFYSLICVISFVTIFVLKKIPIIKNLF